jgi:hypothetical protein
LSEQQPTSKKLEAKRARRLAEERKAAERKKAQRKRSLITIGLAVGVAVLVVGLIYFQKPDAPGSVDDVGGPPTAEEAGCTTPQEHEIEGREHVDDGVVVEYATDPPTSGNHYQTPADPGFYATELPTSQLVHNLEHGQVIFWYKPDAPEEVKDKIEQVIGQPDRSTIAVPYDFEGPGEFAMTAWGVSQSCEQVSQTVINDFRENYQGKGPEQFTPPFEG